MKPKYKAGAYVSFDGKPYRIFAVSVTTYSPEADDAYINNVQYQLGNDEGDYQDEDSIEFELVRKK